MREAAKVLLGVLLALLLLGWVLRGQDLESVGASLARASVAGLLLAAALNLGHNLFRVLRWRALLEPVRPGIGARPLWSAVLIGYMTTWVLPGRLGEVVRPALLSGRERLPLGPCLGSVLADRLLDGWAIVALFVVGTWTTTLGRGAEPVLSTLRTTALAVMLLATLGLVALTWTAARRRSLEPRLGQRRGPLAWVARAVLSVSRGSEALRTPSRVARILVHSLLAWLVIDLAAWVGVRASGAEVPFGGILVLMPLLALGIALPTPGGVGGYHAAMTFGLHGLFDVPREVAVSAGLLMHLVSTVPVILAGLILLRVDGLSWADLRAAAAGVARLGQAPAAAER
jgi:uncharacterized protein (TIRG00374 family)